MSRRAAVLSLLVLISLAVALPLVRSLAYNNRAALTQHHARHHHSRAWWRRHRAVLRRKRAAALKRKFDLTANRDQHANPSLPVIEKLLTPNLPPALGGLFTDARGISLTLPEGWRNRSSLTDSEIKFQVNAPDGRPAGEASLTPVAPAPGSVGVQPIMNQRRMIAGVPFTELRRIVIDKMIAAGGWVVNDVLREIGGRRVFVVLAQTGDDNDRHTPPQAWSFYFTEVDGHVYSFTAHAPLEYSERMAAESEKVMASLRSRKNATAMETMPR
ncbi:MAG TPA: hypothetical protein VGO91_17680 [Pyrinomonadaceae bacterium]|jgi:hypothetical protein|nr:hypothetical protein [Pyrinomonadaceae bacterium]